MTRKAALSRSGPAHAGAVHPDVAAAHRPDGLTVVQPPGGSRENHASTNGSKRDTIGASRLLESSPCAGV
jgi:hypothetical protein